MTVQGYIDLIELLGAGMAFYALREIEPPPAFLVITELAAVIGKEKRDKLTKAIIEVQTNRPLQVNIFSSGGLDERI